MPAAARAQRPWITHDAGWRLAMILWSAGVCWSVMPLAAGAIAVRRLARRSTPAPAPLIEALDSAAEQLRLPRGRRPVLYVAAPDETLLTPVTWGWLRPVILLPRSYGDAVPGGGSGRSGRSSTSGDLHSPHQPITPSPDQASAALLHELAHVQRGDWLWLVGARVLCALYWCLSPVWLAALWLRRETEMACDDRALEAGAAPTAYAALLLDVAKAPVCRPYRVPTGALAMARPPFVDGRIRAILAPAVRRNPPSRAALALAAGVLALVVPLLSLRATAAPSLDVGPPTGAAAGEMAGPPSVQSEADSGPPSGIVGGSVSGPASAPRRSAPELAAAGSDSPIVPDTALVKPGKYQIRAMNFASTDGSKWPKGSQAKTAWIGIQILAARTNSGGSTRAVASLAAGAQKNNSSAGAGRSSANASYGDAAAAKGARADGTALVWGPVREGLQAGIRLESAHAAYAPGEDIWQEVYLRNNSARPVTISFIGGYEQQGDPAIVNAAGKTVKVLRYFGMGAMFMRTKTVQPGEMALMGRVATAFQQVNSDLKEIAPGLSAAAENNAIAIGGAGTYTLRQQIGPQAADSKSVTTVSTGAVRIRIAGPAAGPADGTPEAIPDLKTAPVAWGPVQSGLRIGVMTLDMRQHYFAGERVRLVTILRNVSTEKITFWHEASFPALEQPDVLFGAKNMGVTMTPAADWEPLRELRMTGVTYDMTFAPSASGPSRLVQSEINPGQAVAGYALTVVTVPRLKMRSSKPMRMGMHIVQPLRVGLGAQPRLDTTLRSGALDLQLEDPDPELPRRTILPPPELPPPFGPRP